jgi:hypothetical protein
MTEDQKAAYVIAQSVEAFSIIVAMAFDNVAALSAEKERPHSAAAVQKVCEDRGLYHNALMSFFHN